MSSQLPMRKAKSVIRRQHCLAHVGGLRAEQAAGLSVSFAYLCLLPPDTTSPALPFPKRPLLSCRDPEIVGRWGLSHTSAGRLAAVSMYDDVGVNSPDSNRQKVRWHIVERKTSGDPFLSSQHSSAFPQTRPHGKPLHTSPLYPCNST